MYWCCGVQTGVIACTGVVVFRQVTLFEELVLLKEYEKSENVLAEKVANKQQEKLEMHNKVNHFPSLLCGCVSQCLHSCMCVCVRACV